MVQAISKLQVEGEERSMKDSFRRDLRRRQHLSRAWRKGKLVPGWVKKLKKKKSGESNTPDMCSWKKVLSVSAFLHIWEEPFAVFVSFKKPQHTITGKKIQNILTQRNKTHHDIFSFALNSEFGGLFSWCGCCHRLLTFLTWLDPCSAVYFRLPFLDHLKVFRFIQQNISACQLWRAGACRRYIFPLQVALAANFSLGWALVPKKPSVAWAPVTFEWISFSVYCFIWVMAIPAVCEWREEPIVLFLYLVISKLLFA